MCFFKAIPSHPCFVAPCLTHFFPHLLSLHSFLHLHPVCLPRPRCYTGDESIHRTLQGGLCFGRLAEQAKPVRNLISVTLNRSPTVPSSSSSHRPGNLTAKCSALDSSSTAKLPAMDSNKDKALGSQVCHADRNPNSSMEKPAARSKKSTIAQILIPHNFDTVATQRAVFGPSLPIRTTETWSSKGGQNGADQHQCCDLENIHTRHG